MIATRSKRHRFLAPISIVVTLGWLAAGCSPAADLRASDLASALGLGDGQPANTIEAFGAIEAEQVIISSELSGRVVAVHVDEGESVEQGQILVALDDSLISTQIVSAQADLEAAEAELASVMAGPRPAQVAGQVAAIEQARVPHRRREAGLG